MKTRAAVAWEAGKPLEIEEIDLDGPKEGEVLLRNVASGVCHTDAFTLSGEDPEGIFPVVLGHEGGAIVEEIGAGVTSVKVGDKVKSYNEKTGETEGDDKSAEDRDHRAEAREAFLLHPVDEGLQEIGHDP